MSTELKREIMNELCETIKSFASEHHLSDWERGQLDGLQWAKQIVKEIKTSPANRRNADEAN
jgi:hypothetical protein